MKNKILLALKAHYEALVAKNEALLENYLQHSAGIGEHPDIIEECVKIVDNLVGAKDSLNEVLKQIDKGWIHKRY